MRFDGWAVSHLARRKDSPASLCGSCYRLRLLQSSFAIQRLRPEPAGWYVVKYWRGRSSGNRTSKLPQPGTASCLMMRMALNLQLSRESFIMD